MRKGWDQSRVAFVPPCIFESLIELRGGVEVIGVQFVPS